MLALSIQKSILRPHRSWQSEIGTDFLGAFSSQSLDGGDDERNTPGILRQKAETHAINASSKQDLDAIIAHSFSSAPAHGIAKVIAFAQTNPVSRPLSVTSVSQMSVSSQYVFLAPALPLAQEIAERAVVAQPISSLQSYTPSNFYTRFSPNHANDNASYSQPSTERYAAIERPSAPLYVQAQSIRYLDSVRLDLTRLERYQHASLVQSFSIERMDRDAVRIQAPLTLSYQNDVTAPQHTIVARIDMQRAEITTQAMPHVSYEVPITSTALSPINVSLQMQNVAHTTHQISSHIPYERLQADSVQKAVVAQKLVTQTLEPTAYSSTTRVLDLERMIPAAQASTPSIRGALTQSLPTDAYMHISSVSLQSKKSTIDSQLVSIAQTYVSSQAVAPRIVSARKESSSIDSMVSDVPNLLYQSQKTSQATQKKQYVDIDGKKIDGAYIAVEKKITAQDIEAARRATGKQDALSVAAYLLQQQGYDVQVVMRTYTDTKTGKEHKGRIIEYKNNAKENFHILVGGVIPDFEHNGVHELDANASVDMYLKIVGHGENIGHVKEFAQSTKERCVGFSARVQTSNYNGMSVEEAIYSALGKTYSAAEIQTAIASGAIYVSRQQQKNELGGAKLALNERVDAKWASMHIFYQKNAFAKR